MGGNCSGGRAIRRSVSSERLSDSSYQSLDEDFPDNQFYEDDFSQSNSEMFSDALSDPPPNSDEPGNLLEDDKEGFSPTISNASLEKIVVVDTNIPKKTRKKKKKKKKKKEKNQHETNLAEPNTATKTHYEISAAEIPPMVVTNDIGPNSLKHTKTNGNLKVQSSKPKKKKKKKKKKNKKEDSTNTFEKLGGKEDSANMFERLRTAESSTNAKLIRSSSDFPSHLSNRSEPLFVAKKKLSLASETPSSRPDSTLFTRKKETQITKEVRQMDEVDVATWISSMGKAYFPYGEVFLASGVHGRLLLTMDKSDYRDLGVTNNFHIKKIMMEIGLLKEERRKTKLKTRRKKNLKLNSAPHTHLKSSKKTKISAKRLNTSSVSKSTSVSKAGSTQSKDSRKKSKSISYQSRNKTPLLVKSKSVPFSQLRSNNSATSSRILSDNELHLSTKLHSQWGGGTLYE